MYRATILDLNNEASTITTIDNEDYNTCLTNAQTYLSNNNLTDGIDAVIKIEEI